MNKEELECEVLSIAILFDKAKEGFIKDRRFKRFIHPLALTAKFLDKKLIDFDSRNFNYSNNDCVLLIQASYNLDSEKQIVAKMKELNARILIIFRIFAYLI